MEKIRFVGFCGADDSVDPLLLALISRSFHWVEWGVLFRSDLQGTARYASPEWVQRLSQVALSERAAGRPFPLAAHLCRDRCQAVLHGEATEFLRQLSAWGFQRVQVNITAANGVVVDQSRLGEYAETIHRTIRSFPDIEWLFQLNSETMPLWLLLQNQGEVPANLSLLNDASCGKGVAITEFPSPLQFGGIPCGYAGGIGPTNIAKVAQKIAETVAPHPLAKAVWFDMESSLRTIVVEKGGEQRDIFDINKCFACIREMAAFGFPQID